MPVISAFYGITVSMYFMDNRRHHRPHVHARYQDAEAVFAVDDGEVLEGTLPPGKLRLVLAWIEIHRDELLENWKFGGKWTASLEDRALEISYESPR